MLGYSRECAVRPAVRRTQTAWGGRVGAEQTHDWCGRRSSPLLDRAGGPVKKLPLQGRGKDAGGNERHHMARRSSIPF
jgi:hypothetical protein